MKMTPTVLVRLLLVAVAQKCPLLLVSAFGSSMRMSTVAPSSTAAGGGKRLPLSTTAGSGSSAAARVPARRAPAIRKPSHAMKSLDLLPQFPRTWVPLASTYELDPDRPTPLQFLGNNYVAYKDNSGRWSVLDDACAHRLVPLSEGRVDRDADALECAYHGWSFDADGSCKRIPQAPEDMSERWKANPRACVRAYPTTVEKGVVFMWPWSEDVLSVASDPSAHPEAMMGGVYANSSSYTRDLPYGWDMLLENIVDPAHIPFAHHGMQGTRSDSVPIKMSVPEDIDERGFSLDFEDRTMKMDRKGKLDFNAPYMVDYNGEFDTDPVKPFKLSVLCIPTKPGWSRTIIFSGRGKMDGEEGGEKKKKKKKSLVAVVFKLLPVWVTHLLSNRFLDSDLAFLHYQGLERTRRGPEAERDYFIPAQSDRCVDALRKWVKKYAHVPGKSEGDKAETEVGAIAGSSQMRTELFDHYGQHTSHCVHCLQALEGFKMWRKRAGLVAVLSVLLIRSVFARCTLVGSLALLVTLDKIEPAFRKGDFKHYQNN